MCEIRYHWSPLRCVIVLLANTINMFYEIYEKD